MRYANGKPYFRVGLPAVLIAGLIAGPACAFGAMGGFGPGFGGFHGGFRGATSQRPPAPTSRPPFANPSPSMRLHDHDHDHFFHTHFHGRFDRRFRNGFGWGWGWGGGYAVYAASEHAQPVYVAEPEARPPEPPPCPVLLTWSPKLGRATSQRLCSAD